MFSGSISGVGEYQIVRLHLGELTVPAGTPMGGRALPVDAFLVRHPDGVLLFDTGLGPVSEKYDPVISPVVRHQLVEALDANGLRAEDVAAVVNCHLHYDHCGGNEIFPGVPTYIQEREFLTRDEINFYLADRVEYAAANVQLIDGEKELFSGLKTVLTPGHTPGHQSLVINDYDGPVILAGQAAYTATEFSDPHQEPARGFKTAWNGEAFLASIEQLRALNPRRVYFAHDAQHWVLS